MKILGIDPGIGRCGWGVIEVQGSKVKVQSYGCIETSSKKEISKRLEEVYDKVSKIIQEYSPDA